MLRGRGPRDHPGESAPETMPHCDSSILHAPGECVFCDQRPDWQHLRDLWRINFTGRDDPDRAPCPSVHFRPAERRDAWYGNVAQPIETTATEWTPADPLATP